MRTKPQYPTVFLLVSCALILFLLTGDTAPRSPFGLRTQAECDALMRTPDKIVCYHEAALTAAYLGDDATATTLCEDIWLQFGLGRSADTARVAELETNTCYYDIAKLVRDPNLRSQLCELIRHKTAASAFVGEPVTQEMCRAEIRSLNERDAYLSRADSICNILFILPLLVVGVLCFGAKGSS